MVPVVSASNAVLKSVLVANFLLAMMSCAVIPLETLIFSDLTRLVKFFSAITYTLTSYFLSSNSSKV